MKKTLLWALLILILLGALYVGSAIGIRNIRASVAEKTGTEFIAKLYAEYQIVGASCQGEDTDSDSYVSCDFRIKNPAQEEKVVHLQCPTVRRSILGNTCKETRLIINQ